MSTRAAFSLAAVSGLLLALSFPEFGHPACAWVALTPLLVALRGRSLRHAFLLGLAAGAIYFTGTLYWITRVMAMHGDMPAWVAVLVNAALIAYLSLFPGVFALLMRRLLVSYGSRALLAAPCVWVATELGRTYIFTGFPWVLLGYSQVSVLPIAQLASLVGVYGVSLLVAAASASVAMVAYGSGTAEAVPYGTRFTRTRFAPLIATLAVVGAVAVWGSRRAAAAEWTRTGEPVTVGLIQGNVDQGEKWDPTRSALIFREYLDLTRRAIREGAGFVIWPESSTPFMFDEDPGGAELIRTVVRQARVPILFGSDQIERGKPDRYFNSAFMVRSDGTTAGVYRKMHLVPFGEYVPLQSLFFFAAPLTEQVGTFSPGLEPVLLPVDGHRVSVNICYEVVYPDLVRRFVAGGSEMLTMITNDAWFGRTSAPYQHFAQASMRAIEEGRYMVRAANTGISGIVDPYGRVVAQTGIFQPAVLVGEARFLRTRTVYSRYGDIVAYASAVAALVLLVLGRRVK